MIRILLGFIISMVFHAAIANENYRDIALESDSHVNEAMTPYLADAIYAKRKMTLIHEEKLNNKEINKKYPFAIVFVSFSMPDQSLVSILQDAKKIGASVVIRGLANNSFKDTFFKVSKIVKMAKGGGIELNPPLFKKFHIHAIPALVVLPSSNTCVNEALCPVNNFDVVYGDIPISDGLKAIRDHGDIAKGKASDLVDQGEAFHA